MLGSGHTMGGVARSQPREIWATGSQGYDRRIHIPGKYGLQVVKVTTEGFTSQGNMGYR